MRSRTSSTHVHSSHMHELVEIADQREAMECIWHGRMELNQTYVNDKENNISDLDVGKFYMNDKENNISDLDVGEFTGEFAFFGGRPFLGAFPAKRI